MGTPIKNGFTAAGHIPHPFEKPRDVFRGLRKKRPIARCCLLQSLFDFIQTLKINLHSSSPLEVFLWPASSDNFPHDSSEFFHTACRVLRHDHSAESHRAEHSETERTHQKLPYRNASPFLSRSPIYLELTQ
jgi:hypothetical protein